jgi:hypothetical protein
MCSGRKKDQMMEIIIVENRAFLLCSECGWNRETEISDSLREELKKAREKYNAESNLPPSGGFPV